MKNIVAFVPLKLNNERLPGKNLKKFSDGTPLVSCALETLSKVPDLDETYVYCSDEKVIPYLPAGIKFLKRSKGLDQSSTKINEVLLSFAMDVPANVYVLVHATAPFLSAQSIEKGISQVCSGKNDSALAVCKMQEFFWKNGQPMNYDISAVPRTQDLDPIFVETTGLYIYTRDLIVDGNTRIGSSPYLIEVSKVESIDINDAEDFEIADALYSGFVKSRIFP